MTLRTKQTIIAILASAFLVSLVFVQWMEVARKQEEAGLKSHSIAVPASSKDWPRRTGFCISNPEMRGASSWTSGRRRRIGKKWWPTRSLLKDGRRGALASQRAGAVA